VDCIPAQKGTTLGIVTTSSETAFMYPNEVVYDFVTNPANWTVQYHFTQPGEGITLFTRTMTIEAYKHAPLPDAFFRTVNPANIDAYHAAIVRELAM
jgi:hypothetical protein